MSILLSLVGTTGEQYLGRFEAALSAAKNSGAEVCVFGDIDREVADEIGKPGRDKQQRCQL